MKSCNFYSINFFNNNYFIKKKYITTLGHGNKESSTFVQRHGPKVGSFWPYYKKDDFFDLMPNGPLYNTYYDIFPKICRHITVLTKSK